MQKDTLVEISSILQCQKAPQGILIRLENFIPTRDYKTHFAPQKTSKNQKLEKNRNYSKTFLIKVLGKSHSAENPKKFSVLAKRFISRKNREVALIKTNWKNVAWKNATKIISVLKKSLSRLNSLFLSAGRRDSRARHPPTVAGDAWQHLWGHVESAGGRRCCQPRHTPLCSCQ